MGDYTLPQLTIRELAELGSGAVCRAHSGTGLQNLATELLEGSSLVMRHWFLVVDFLLFVKVNVVYKGSLSGSHYQRHL